jgi:hypothetical protein
MPTTLGSAGHTAAYDLMNSDSRDAGLTSMRHAAAALPHEPPGHAVTCECAAPRRSSVQPKAQAHGYAADTTGRAEDRVVAACAG